MRILHVTTEFPPVIFGGLGTAVGGLVNASAHAGLEVGVLLVGGVLPSATAGYGHPNAIPRTPALPQTDSGVTFFQIAPEDDVSRAVDIARAWQPDVLHLHTAWVWPHAEAIIERANVPLVYTVHSVDRAEYDIGRELGHILDHCTEQELAIDRASRLVALTRDESQLLDEYYPAASPRVRIVGNGIDDSATAREAAGSDTCNKSPMVLYSGRLVERKGIRDLMAAIPYVLERAPGTRFVLAGGPPPLSGDEVARQWLTDSCAPYRGQIHFTGWLTPSALENWYRAADIQVVPSRYEPFGMVVLEGMLYGLAIVASAVGGPCAILRHGETGLLYPPSDVPALADAVLTLVRDASLRRRIGAAAAADVRSRWLWPSIVSQMAGVYEEAAYHHNRAQRHERAAFRAA